MRGKAYFVGLFEGVGVDLRDADVVKLSLGLKLLQRSIYGLEGEGRVNARTLEEVQFLLSVEGGEDCVDAATKIGRGPVRL